MLTRDEATTRVARGAAYLDQTTPDWARKIDVGTLNIENACLCVLGQVYGSYFEVLKEQGWKTAVVPAMEYSTDAGRLGFCLLPDDVYLESEHLRHREIYAVLQDVWIAAITDRVLAAAQAHREPQSVNAIDPSAQPQESRVRA